MAKKQIFFYAVGRRKSASARVRLFKGKGENLVNDLAAEKYFPGPVNKILLDRPFILTETLGRYYFTVKVIGSGKNGQLKALIHGVARALSLADREKFRSPLKKAGLLTRDPRERERRMVGTGGKARRAKQSPKR
ncbi:MAG: 30S ribosomal protein S9 [Candidatus Woesebacteria bacterium GW2011_GWA2_44_33]|uniref:Small ribosomal subunit protein uS9 n=3 Tax=Microgenomates group TaxID=1794810 RepID=A0A0G1R9Z8_9BACT|nr:MAG: 30S ribosomal protein S9 [Candidatus Woesebacteria bacterium GW2011_GWA2_44_33]KKT67832.1 MAG: 30S ribosomal protein S9 [Candidatus Curtissbacteria bacterium GW2011_GWC1_44_33]KKU17715.1 MAG: 30S ribosomal protein S9 [Candidatus Woesebacteria bacterium GW2011_GWC2_45_9]